MNLRHLETFHWFCRFLSMSRTAEHLNISQPAVSQQLKSFEAECQVKLFYRENNQYRLTETGDALYLLSKRVFSRVEQMDELLAKSRQDTSEHLLVGTTKAYARTIMPDMIALFQKQFPTIHVRLSEGNSADLIRRLRERKEDVVMTARSRYDSGVKAIPFRRAEFILAARPDHPLAADGAPVSIRCLAGETLIIREQGSGSRQEILKKLNEHGVTPTMIVESESLSFILAYIERKMGVSFILAPEIERELAQGVLKKINLIEGDVGFPADIVIRSEEHIPVHMRQFIRIAKQTKTN